MKRTCFLSIIFLCFTFFAFSQGTDWGNLSLQDALDHAAKNSPSVIIQRLKQRQQEEKLSQTKLDNLPNFYATADLRRNIIIPATPIPANMIDPNAGDDELMYMRFNTPWSSATGLNLNYDIFNPETFGLRAEQERQLAISKIETEIAERDLLTNIEQAYMDAVIAQEQAEAVLADTLYYFDLFEKDKQLFESEKISLADKNNTEMEYLASVSRYLQAENILHNAKADLLMLLGEQISGEKLRSLRFSEDIPALYSKMQGETLQEISRNSLSERRQSELLYLSEQRIKNVSLKYLPTLSLLGYYGANYYGKDLQLSNTEKWFGNSYLALSLKIPITRSLSTSKEISQLRTQAQIEQENLRDMQNRKQNELAREAAQLEVHRKNYELKQANLALIRQNVAAKELQYEKGYILNAELSAERLRYRNAFQEYLQAAYDALSAQIALRSTLEN